MSTDHTRHVLHAAGELCKAMNETVDEHMPEKLAGIVKTHSAIAVGTALVPIPIVDVAAAVTNIWTMYVRINKEVNIPFAENALRSIALGIVTNIGAGLAAGVVLGTVAKFLPIVGTFGGTLVMGSTVYAVTLASSVIYMKALTKLLASKVNNSCDMTAGDLKAAVKETMKDKDLIKTVMDDAKAGYVEEKKTKEAVTA
jgi:uncharacterized protein (DUF697 family)